MHARVCMYARFSVFYGGFCYAVVPTCKYVYLNVQSGGVRASVLIKCVPIHVCWREIAMNEEAMDQNIAHSGVLARNLCCTDRLSGT